MPTTKRRTNGLDKPFHSLQIATWFIYPLILIHYYLFLLPLFWYDNVSKIVVTVIFTIASILAGYFAYRTCAIDPADKSNELQEVIPVSQDDAKIYCYLCEYHVHNTSKHCRFCDKCVLRFDHHCKWLNTCVGENNYKQFLGVVTSVSVLTTISLVLIIVFLVESYQSPDMIMQRDNILDALTLDWLKSILIVSLIIFTPLVLLVYQLAGFHAMINYYGMTTYDFIVEENKKQREKASLKKEAKKQNKATPVKKAIVIHERLNDNEVNEDKDVNERGRISLDVNPENDCNLYIDDEEEVNDNENDIELTKIPNDVIEEEQEII